MKGYVHAHRLGAGLTGAVVALAIAAMFTQITPDSAGAGPVTAFVLGYGHALVWFLLAGASAAYGLRLPRAWPTWLSLAAFAMYVVFLAVTITHL